MSHKSPSWVRNQCCLMMTWAEPAITAMQDIGDYNILQPSILEIPINIIGESVWRDNMSAQQGVACWVFDWCGSQVHEENLSKHGEVRVPSSAVLGFNDIFKTYFGRPGTVVGTDECWSRRELSPKGMGHICPDLPKILYPYNVEGCENKRISLGVSDIGVKLAPKWTCNIQTSGFSSLVNLPLYLLSIHIKSHELPSKRIWIPMKSLWNPHEISVKSPWSKGFLLNFKTKPLSFSQHRGFCLCVEWWNRHCNDPPGHSAVRCRWFSQLFYKIDV